MSSSRTALTCVIVIIVASMMATAIAPPSVDAVPRSHKRSITRAI
jgi:hypothetical protein